MSAIEVVRSARARRARLSVDPASGRVRLVLPRRAALAPAMRWAEEHRDWIADQQQRLPAPRPFVPGAMIPLGDATLRLEWREEATRAVRREGGLLVCGGPIEGFPGRIARWLRREALEVLTAETHDHAARAGVTVSSVGIGDPRGRWGSCSAAGGIRYSWRLIFAPAHVRRSTVAHEVAHRLHMDHSPAFHAAVTRIDAGDPAAARAWLRANGAALHWFGRDS